MSNRVFNAYQTPLNRGMQLIEASAGTGKTYAIALLVLRFVVEQAVDIKQLVVVTYTKAATEELKTRIRQRLAATQQAIQHQQFDDAALQQWYQNLSLDDATVRQRLDAALQDIDQAAIFTIHGFCQRILVEQALESGQLFDCTLTGDIKAIRQRCVDDFWRQQLLTRPPHHAAWLVHGIATPEALLASLGSYQPQRTVYPVAADLTLALDAISHSLSNAHSAFSAQRAQFDALLNCDAFTPNYRKTLSKQLPLIAHWFSQPDNAAVDCSCITRDGILNGLNGSKFRSSKSKPHSSEQQKQDYVTALSIDCSPFETLTQQLQQLPVLFRRCCWDSLHTALETALQQANVLSFDDLISRLANALTRSDASALIAALQQRFQVGLIDEFQDTDHAQWQIFSTLFSAEHHSVYLIGDPKQAIYKFRGADIFSYFSAQQQTQQHFSLSHNWRSHPDLVTGINALFTRDRPFAFSQLTFTDVIAGRQAHDGAIANGAPLHLWQLEALPNDKHWGAGAADSAIEVAVINELLALLAQGQFVKDNKSRTLHPQDMAILVRSNIEAARYQQALSAVGIPAVLNSKQSVFASPQAAAVYQVLSAVSDPYNHKQLIQALTLSWFGLDGPQLRAIAQSDADLEAWSKRFYDYQQHWHQHGLLAMMQQLLATEQVSQRLAQQPQAERQLTNIHHVIERLQQVSSEQQLAQHKLLQWLQQTLRDADQAHGEDQPLRLESDAAAVSIITLHSAKGLEYPIVFCPNLWRRSDRLSSEKQQLQCHENGEMVVDLGSADFEKRRQKALTEELAEDLRLLYVAVTRAQYRCYVAWADVRSKEKPNASALAYLLQLGQQPFTGQQAILQGLANTHPAAIGYCLLPAKNTIAGHYHANTATPNLQCRQPQRSISASWQLTSYSALTARRTAAAHDWPEDRSQEGNDDSMDSPADSLTLPKGAVTGNVLHSLLQTESFAALAKGALNPAAREHAMRRFGLSLSQPASIDTLLQAVVTTPLDDSGWSLQQLSPKACIKEMPFLFTLNAVDRAAITTLLQHCPDVQALSPKALSGYLSGFIDLIACHQGRYYVIDYKSNCLPDYQPHTLQSAMRAHDYGLQYWLYSVALEGYLQQRLPDYDPAQHFGGVKYLFLRGMQPRLAGSGVYSTLPEIKTRQALARLFFGSDSHTA